MGQVYNLGQAKGDESAHAAQGGSQAHIFIGLKIAPEIASRLARFVSALEKSSIRPIAPADIHLTLVPPWNETSIPDAVEKLGRVAGRFGAFSLTFQHVGYGPQPRRPRLLWADCAATDEIAALRAALLQAYGQTDERPFYPHVTLARIRAAGSAPARKYPIDQPLSLTQRVNSVELFRSPPAGRNRLSGSRLIVAGRNDGFSAHSAGVRRPATTHS